MDRISVLPKTILHDILGRLPDKDAAKTSVLSKSWSQTWFSFPVVAAWSEGFFNLPELPLSQEDPLWLSRLDIFIGYVSKRLRRLHDQGLAVKELKINMKYISDKMLVSLSHHLDEWIQMASESGVEVLALHLTLSLDKFYNLPLCLVEAKSLTTLVLIGGIRLDPAFLNHSLKFFSVRTLLFSGTLVEDERAMEHFISHCPLVEYLTLIDCLPYKPSSVGDPPGSRAHYVKSLSLHGLQKLKQVDVQGIEEVYIDAPNLENLRYVASIWDASKLNLSSYKNLRRLSLRFVRSADMWLLERLPKIPFLESLTLKDCSLSERINISGPQLKFFRLSNCPNLKEVNIDAPNLLSCEYFGNDEPVISFRRISNQLEVNARIHMDHHQDVDRLRQFIQNIEPQEVLMSLSLCIILPDSIIESLATLPGSSSPPTIKHMQLCSVSPRQTQYFPFMNWLLSSCFPETVSFSLNHSFNMREFMVYFYEMLMGSKKGECYCFSRGPECWWHGLKVVKITHLERTYENVEDLKAMLNALPFADNYEEGFISFTLEL
ncbi:F-box/LRR-repeat protein 13-like [Arachis stenosperma]|uniref:F-box/LRR-repeat protein 13-like n=1 Tax=Arachis stenosperma TaxID=217475 RepID=UPI0025AD050C|nr:F-box/LRR-repeat protein 13-like [Arachis stenosperma]